MPICTPYPQVVISTPSTTHLYTPLQPTLTPHPLITDNIPPHPPSSPTPSQLSPTLITTCVYQHTTTPTLTIPTYLHTHPHSSLYQHTSTPTLTHHYTNIPPHPPSLITIPTYLHTHPHLSLYQHTSTPTLTHHYTNIPPHPPSLITIPTYLHTHPHSSHTSTPTLTTYTLTTNNEPHNHYKCIPTYVRTSSPPTLTLISCSCRWTFTFNCSTSSRSLRIYNKHTLPEVLQVITSTQQHMLDLEHNCAPNHFHFQLLHVLPELACRL